MLVVAHVYTNQYGFLMARRVLTRFDPKENHHHHHHRSFSVAPHAIAVAGEALTATNLWREDRVAFTLSIAAPLPWHFLESLGAKAQS